MNEANHQRTQGKDDGDDILHFSVGKSNEMSTNHGWMDEAEWNNQIEILGLEEQPNETRCTQEQNGIVIASYTGFVEVVFTGEINATYDKKDKTQRPHHDLFVRKLGIDGQTDVHDFTEMLREHG